MVRKQTRKQTKKQEGPLTEASYKVPASLTRYMSDRWMILSRSQTGASAKKQRAVSREIKRARYMALIPYTYKHEI